MQKTIKAKIKTSLYPPLMLPKIDQHVTRSRRSVESTKFSSLGVPSKDFRIKLPKKSEVLSYQMSLAKVSNKARKKKKQDRRNYGQKFRKRQFQAESLTQATKVNVLEPSNKKKKRKEQGNINQITCYNCDKKKYYASICPDPPKY